ncbi:MAG: Rossmann-like and DUF2520 domain-containing protein [Planctomycetota bacterium]|nr:Rossmann-like and DUF2520 domain-containing protein [Planctomycetota bacterium]
MNDKPDIVIIGPGKVGRTLAILAGRAGWPVAGIGARDEDKARAAAEDVGPDVRAGKIEQIAPMGQLVLLTVSDDAIEPLCRHLAETGCFGRGAVVAHCCGAIASDVLSPARELCGAAIGSMHPLQTFPDVDAVLKKLPGSYCFCEGDERAVEALENLADAVGGKPVRMSPDGKLLYHASAVMACNYFTALIDSALATAGHAGIGRSDALAALEPLVRATMENVFSSGPEKALTGPIARGDDRLVSRQFADISSADKNLGDIYRTLGRWAVDVALRKGTIDEEKTQKLWEIFGEK